MPDAASAARDFEISTDKARLDLDAVERGLHDTYWAYARERSVIEKSINTSLCLGAYRKSDGRLVGFGRVVTDYCTFAYICDVFVDTPFRGQGIGKLLMKTLVELPELDGLWLTLITADAHGLYAQNGFILMPQPERWMSRPGNEPPVLR